MKTIKLHEEEYVTLATGIELNEIPEYVKKSSLARQGMPWMEVRYLVLEKAP